MGNFDDTKPKSAKETLVDCIESLDGMMFSMACYVDQFKRYLKKAGLYDESKA